jgi:hypothetical protein
MGTNPQAEVLPRIARYKELIEKSRKLREESIVLIEHSHQLRIALGQEVDREGNNEKTDARFPEERP